MTAINITTGKSYASRHVIRVAKKTGIPEDTIYRWIKEGKKVKQHGDYLLLLNTEIL
jgi:hypothetical protein